MKNKNKCVNRLSLLAALIAVIGFSFASCKPAADSTEAKYVSTDGTNTYELVISAPRAAYSPKDGDTYVLTITVTNTGVSVGTSTGTVATVRGNTFTLQPARGGAAPFQVTISGGNLTDITESITLDSGISQPAPGPVTPTNSGNNSGGNTSGSSTIVSGATVKYSSDYITNTNMTDAKSRTDFSYIPFFGDWLDQREPLNEVINEPTSVTISDSKVTIKLGIPKDDFLARFNWWKDWLSDRIIVSDWNARVMYDDDFVFTTSDEKYLLICAKDEKNIAFLCYADRDVTFKGTSEYRWKVDCTFKKGWNYLINSEVGNGTTTSSLSQPSGYYWVVDNFSDF